MYNLKNSWKQLCKISRIRNVAIDFRVQIIALLIFFLGIINVSMARNLQGITLDLRDATLKEVFTRISKQSQYKFLYDESIVDKEKHINIKFEDSSIEQVLNKVLTPEYSFRIIANTISISKEQNKAIKNKLNTTNNMNVQQEIVVRGTVKNESGVELTGATISVKGTTRSVVTNQNGEFEIQAKEDAVLVVSFLGHDKRELNVNNRTVIHVVLKELFSEIAGVDVVATGYQTIDRKLFTGATTNIKAKDAERSGIQDISRMLEGQAAGVSVQNVSGTFGAAPKIRVRGATSITGDNKPLWVIDGVILDEAVNISNEALSTGDASTLLGSSVAGINPDDIEEFTILKDAAATAMYGAAAMNGVVIVKTKRGINTDGVINVNYSGNYSTYLKPNYNEFDILNSAEQMSLLIDLENKGYLNHSSISRASTGGVFHKMYNLMYDYDESTDTFGLRNDRPSRYNFLNRYAQANTDWFNLLFKSSLMHDHSLSVTTGTDKSQTYVSTSFLSDAGFTLGNNNKRFTANLNNTFKVSDKVRVELLIQGNIRDQVAPGTINRQSDPVYGNYSRDFDINPYSYAINTSRIITPYNEDGGLEYFTRDYAPFNILNELENNYMNLKVMDLKVQGGVNYDITPNLKYSINGMYRYFNSERQHSMTENSNVALAYKANENDQVNSANRFLYDDPDFPNYPNYVILPNGGFFNTSNNNMVSYYFRQNLEFDKKFNEDHHMNLFGTMEVRYADRQNHDFTGPGIEFDNGNLVMPTYRYYKKTIEGGGTPFDMWYTYDRYSAFAFRGAYNYREKYSFNFTTRYDGSNNMGKSKIARWLPTWNLSGAWDIHNEDFFPDLGEYLSSARLRSTYGLVANIGNASNSTAVFYNELTYRPYESEREGKIAISGLENSELTWEKMYEWNIGADIGLLNNRMDIHVDYYQRNSFDLIGSVRTSGIGGQFTKVANYADMKGSGIELEIGGYPIRNDDGLVWRSQFTFSHNTTKVTNMDITRNVWNLVSAEGGAVIGGPHRGLYSLNFEKLNENRGYPVYTGLDGTPGQTYFWLQSDETDYLIYNGPVDPTINGGFYNRFEYKGVSLAFLLKFGFGNYVRLQPSYGASYSDLYNVSKDLINRWVYHGDEFLTVIPSILDGYASSYEVYSDNNERNAASYTYNAYNYSTARVAKGDYIRLSQISLGYVLPNSLLNNYGFKRAQLNLVANNIAVLYADKKLNGVDPEFYANGGVALPMPKQVTLSLKLGF